MVGFFFGASGLVPDDVRSKRSFMKDELQLVPLVQTWRQLMGLTKSERWDESKREWWLRKIRAGRQTHPQPPHPERCGGTAGSRWESTPCRHFADKLHDGGFFMCHFLYQFFCQQSSTNKAVWWDDYSTHWNIILNRIYDTVVPVSFGTCWLKGLLLFKKLLKPTTLLCHCSVVTSIVDAFDRSAILKLQAPSRNSCQKSQIAWFHMCSKGFSIHGSSPTSNNAKVRCSFECDTGFQHSMGVRHTHTHVPLSQDSLSACFTSIHLSPLFFCSRRCLTVL